jgi:uncharacterized membrane protein
MEDRSQALPAEHGRSTGAGALLGVGFAGFVDETVFHQLLHWHHFWDGGSQDAGLVSDGVFHALSTLCLAAGVFVVADLRRRGAAVPRCWVAGLLYGAGGFQLYDGIVQHKWLHLHPIRYHVTSWPYDLAWNVSALAMLIVGLVLSGGAPRLRRRPRRR